MNSERKWNIRPFQNEVLRIFREFECICKKYNLRYYAIGGTALGAVRHGGFIPWDDDFDVSMPREDFNKFVDIIDQELPDHLKFFRGGESKCSPIYFSKIVDVRPDVVRRMREETGLEFDFAPFIDVFVLDGVPEHVGDFGWWWRGRRLIRLCQAYRHPESLTVSNIEPWRRFIIRVVGFFLSFFYPRTKDNRGMMKLLDEFALHWPFATSRMVVEPMFFKMRTRMLMPKEMFDPARIVPFEDGMICVPARVEEHLERWFGDYMTMPPEEHRVPEHLFKRAYNHV